MDANISSHDSLHSTAWELDSIFDLQKFVKQSKEKPTRTHMDPHVPNNKVYMLNEAGRGVSSVHDVWRER